MSEIEEIHITADGETFVEGRDFYFEDGLMVLTRSYHERRGYCCDNDCRHCPYGTKILE
ncbi:MAG: hypothetical protein KF736_11435 [Acidobacteria bacterium]|nr:hypothetical protein [Acidobacteriota bacterium]MCW5949984.1 hypothetical protein [Pyrinomonadaceae bacterium]